MDSLYYEFNELKYGHDDLTSDELNKLSGVAIGALVGLRRELFKVTSVHPLELTLVQNAAF